MKSEGEKILNQKEQSADTQNSSAQDENTSEEKKDVSANKEKMVQIKESEYQNLIKEAAEYKDKCVRIYADFENTRKRLEREKSEFVKYANEGLMSDFLSVLDDLERAVEAATVQHQDYKAFLKGIEIVMARLHEMLKKYNVKPIKSVGEIFDPHCHEILTQMESNDHKDGEVIEEFQKGFMFGDRVLRTSKVKVAVNTKHKQDEI